MACVGCSNFDPHYLEGYCNRYHCPTTPGDTCKYDDSKGGGEVSYPCSTCDHYDPYYHNGYCNYYEVDTNASSTCSKHT